MYELALISVVIAAGYWGMYFVRHDATRKYGIMQLAAAGLSGLGLYARRAESPGQLGIAGAVGVGAGTCLLFIGPLMRALARRMASAERFRIAARLLDVAEVLAPGSGVADEKALLGAMREIRDGNIEQTVDALTAAKDRAPAEARLAIDERIAMLYLAAYRWDEAIAHAEENLFGAAVDPEAASSTTRPAGPTIALRRALGIAPPVWVELLGAYGYKGDLDRAARMLARLEEVCVGRDDAAMWLHRGRMIFLALAGRVAAVETLVEPRRSRHMSRAARTYWVAVAHERKGDGPAAEAAYTKARSRSRGRPRVLIDQALARLPNIRSVELGPAASELVARVEASPPPEVVVRARSRAPWASRLLIAVVLLAAAAVALVLGESSDVGVLLRAGALVRGFVHDGEWWRVVSCIFVHVGGLHLLVNTIGLWFIGRLCEDLFGPVRTIAIFAVAGLGGSLASYLGSPGAVSAGASGAIFGLLGAMFVELTWHRHRHRAAWNRGMLSSVVVVAVAQLADGLLYPMTDQWAHGGGLALGSLMAFVLSPNARWMKPAVYVARAVAVAFGIAVVVAAVMVVRTSVPDSLARTGTARIAIGDRLVVEAPATWIYTDVLHDSDDIFDLRVSRTAGGELGDQLAKWTDLEEKRAHDLEHFDQINVATAHLVPLPPGWVGSELVVSVELPDPIGGRQRYRVVVAARPIADGVVLASLYIPETVAHDTAPFFTKLLGSITAVAQ